MRSTLLLSCTLLILSFSSQAKPKILIKHQRDANNLAEIKIINQTAKKLICYIAIDGHKIKFTLLPRQPSKWYRATDPSFSHQNFSTWCDYLSLHPKYQPKN